MFKLLRVYFILQLEKSDSLR